MTNDSNKPPFAEGMFNFFKDLKPPEMDMKGIMPSVEGQMEMMKAMQKINMETAQALMDLQKNYFQELAKQLNELAKTNMSLAPLAEKKEISEKVMKETSAKTAEHMQDFNAILTKSNQKIMEDIKETFSKTKK